MQQGIPNCYGPRDHACDCVNGNCTSQGINGDGMVLMFVQVIIKD